MVITTRLPAERKFKVLIVASNPVGTDPLNLSEEISLIETALREENGDGVEILAVYSYQLIETFKEFQPNILHFCGHGTDLEGLPIFQTELGQMQIIDTNELSHLFAKGKAHLWGIVLNAGCTRQRIEFVRNHVAFVISMNKEIFKFQRETLRATSL